MTEPERDLEPIGEEVAQQLSEMQRAEDSYLPEVLIQRQAELASLSGSEIAAQLADLVIAAALLGVGATPKRVLENLLRDYKITDETWHEKIGPELRRTLAARGVDVGERLSG